MSNRYVVIMAGGSGTRFWPASRHRHPKQFLSIGGESTLLRQTVQRVLKKFDWSNIIVVTAKVHAKLAKAELPELPDENLLCEPEGRNTAPCIAWATETIHQRNEDAVCVVLPADHFIADEDAFLTHLEAGMNAADESIVLLGLIPTRPETGYGYIEKGDELSDKINQMTVCKVQGFKEKPDLETAAAYLSEGNYLWNSGMFIFRTSVMKAALQEKLPELSEKMAQLAEDPKKIGRIYPKLEKISIDYGVIEKSENLLVVPSSFAWSDVGSWESADELYREAPEDNVILGDAITMEDVSGCFVDARAGRLVALAGVKDVVVVDTTDALLIMPKEQSQRVREIVAKLEENEREELI